MSAGRLVVEDYFAAWSDTRDLDRVKTESAAFSSTALGAIAVKDDRAVVELSAVVLAEEFEFPVVRAVMLSGTFDNEPLKYALVLCMLGGETEF